MKKLAQSLQSLPVMVSMYPIHEFRLFLEVFEVLAGLKGSSYRSRGCQGHQAEKAWENIAKTSKNQAKPKKNNAK